jgi:Bacterial PH domain
MSPQSRSWAPHPGLVAISWVLAAASITWAILADDPPGQVLLAVAALTLVLAGLFGTIARPRLAADADGITVRSLVGRKHWPWAEVNVRLMHTRRFGRDISSVEVDADPDLVVLTRLDLGADPEDVIEAIRALRV